MFSKFILLLFVAGAVVAQLQDGAYRITNVQSNSDVRVYSAGGQLFVSSTNENPGDYAVWDLKSTQDGGYTINNVALDRLLMLDTFAAVFDSSAGAGVFTNRVSGVFNIEPAGDDTHVIKLPYDDLLWNAEPPVIPRGGIALRPADGSDTEKWRFTPV